MLQNGLNIVTDQKLRSNVYTEQPVYAGVQNFRCHATQEMRGRAPIEVVRDFELVVALSNYGMPDRASRRPNIQRPGELSCDQIPGCRPKQPFNPLALVLVIVGSVLLCVVFLAVVIVVAFRCRRRLLGSWRGAQLAALRSARGRRGARSPQYADNDPPRAPLVVTGELPDRSRRPQTRTIQAPDQQSIETLLTPPDYDAATQSDTASSPIVPPPYQTMEVPKDDDNEELELHDIPTTSSHPSSADLTAHVSNSPNPQAIAATSSCSHDAETVL